jgi:hypothetical protein
MAYFAQLKCLWALKILAFRLAKTVLAQLICGNVRGLRWPFTPLQSALGRHRVVSRYYQQGSRHRRRTLR